MRIPSSQTLRQEPVLSTGFHHRVAQRTASWCVWYVLMPLAFGLLFVTRADFWSPSMLAQWVFFCGVAYVAIYGGVYLLSVVAPFLGSDVVEAGGRAVDVSAGQRAVWRVVLALVARSLSHIALRPLRLTAADLFRQWLRGVRPVLRVRLARTAIPSLKTAAPFRLFPFAPLCLPWLLS